MILYNNGYRNIWRSFQWMREHYLIYYFRVVKCIMVNIICLMILISHLHLKMKSLIELYMYYVLTNLKLYNSNISDGILRSWSQSVSTKPQQSLWLPRSPSNIPILQYNLPLYSKNPLHLLTKETKSVQEPRWPQPCEELLSND